MPKNCDAKGEWQSGSECEHVCVGGECQGSCLQGAKQCSGNVPQTCNALGSWDDGSPCEHVCEAGQCTGVCSPNDKDCNGLIPRACDASGQWKSGAACKGVCSAGECKNCDKSTPFDTPVLVAGVNVGYQVMDGTLTADELQLVFSDDRNAGGVVNYDYFQATRTDPNAAFVATVPLATLNTGSDERGITMTGDGLTVLFRSNRSGNYDLFLRLQVQKLPRLSPFVTPTQRLALPQPPRREPCTPVTPAPPASG